MSWLSIKAHCFLKGKFIKTFQEGVPAFLSETPTAKRKVNSTHIILTLGSRGEVCEGNKVPEDLC